MATAAEKIAENREIFRAHLEGALELLAEEEVHDGLLVKEIAIFKDHFLLAHESGRPADD